MTEPDDIQRLIRLKRHELPPEGFMDDFMRQLHQRQREDMLKQSALSLLWERLGTFLEGRTSPNMGLATAAAVVALGGIVWWMPHGHENSGGGGLAANASARAAGVTSPTSLNLSVTPPLVVSPQFSFADQERPTPQPAHLADLLSQHFHGGYADEARESRGTVGIVSTSPYSPNAPIDLADPPMQQNGSLDRIQDQ